MKNIKQKLLISLFLIGAGGSIGFASGTNTPADATITITPIANVSLQLSPTFYDFGPTVSVNASTFSATALTLTNNGQVDVTVTKQITNQSNPAGWNAGVTASSDTYVLYVATSTARPAGVGSFSSGTSMFGALNISTNLQGLGGGTPTLNNPAGTSPSVALWFRLDTPTTVSSQQARAITVRFTGAAL